MNEAAQHTKTSPGTGRIFTGIALMDSWTSFLQAGLITGGVAGVPAGLAIFLRNRRKMLSRVFWFLLIIGSVLEVRAIYLRSTNALNISS